MSISMNRVIYVIFLLIGQVLGDQKCANFDFLLKLSGLNRISSNDKKIIDLLGKKRHLMLSELVSEKDRNYRIWTFSVGGEMSVHTFELIAESVNYRYSDSNGVSINKIIRGKDYMNFPKLFDQVLLNPLPVTNLNSLRKVTLEDTYILEMRSGDIYGWAIRDSFVNPSVNFEKFKKVVQDIEKSLLVDGKK